MKQHHERSRFLVATMVAAHFMWLVFPKAALAEVKEISSYEASILHLTVTRAAPDPESPWALQNTDISGNAGVVIGGNRVLTQASLGRRSVNR